MLLGEVRLPNVLKQQQDNNITTLLLHVPENLAYFAGHFPNIAIVPGVVQLHWAVHFATTIVAINGKMTHGSRIKFSNIILPNDELVLTLEHVLEKQLIIYSYTKQDGKHYSSGCFNYKLKAKMWQQDNGF